MVPCLHLYIVSVQQPVLSDYNTGSRRMEEKVGDNIQWILTRSLLPTNKDLHRDSIDLD
jgi:hypothetical protein